MQHIDYYEFIALASRDMLIAAQRNDWQALMAAEQCCERNIDMVRALQAVKLSSEDQARKRAIIHQVLEDDANIRILTQPWLNELQLLLRGNGARRERALMPIAPLPTITQVGCIEPRDQRPHHSDDSGQGRSREPSRSPQVVPVLDDACSADEHASGKQEAP